MRIARCKFRCTGVEDHGHDVQTVRMQTQYDQAVPEDQRFSRATPMGSLEFRLENPALAGFFQPGQTYYLDVTPVEG